jgi:hypothetical protein
MDNLFVYMCSCFAATQQNAGAESFRSAEFELSTSLIAVIRRWKRAVRTEKNNYFHFSASVRFPKRPHPSRRELPQATAGRDRTETSKTRPEENDFSLAVGLFSSFFGSTFTPLIVSKVGCASQFARGYQIRTNSNP